jgi:hypothetical protein
MNILPETFQPSTASPDEVGSHYATYINGTAQVQLRDGQSITTYAILHRDGSIAALGFVGRYRTGSKLWRCVLVHQNNRTSFQFGFDSRSGKHKQSGVYFCPEKFYNTVVAA